MPQQNKQETQEDWIMNKGAQKESEANDKDSKWTFISDIENLYEYEKK